MYVTEWEHVCSLLLNLCLLFIKHMFGEHVKRSSFDWKDSFIKEMILTVCLCSPAQPVQHNIICFKTISFSPEHSDGSQHTHDNSIWHEHKSLIDVLNTGLGYCVITEFI